MSADRQLMDALADELARLSHEITSTKRWVTEIKSGKQSAELLKRGVSKRDVMYWAGGANRARRVTRDRLAKLYEQFAARIHQ